MFKAKNILITGGTGFLGSAFAKYMIDKQFDKLIIFSTSWEKQEKLKQELSNLGDITRYRWFIGNVRDYERLYMAFENVDIVIHAAAIKNITTCEQEPEECLKTNIIGAQNVIRAALNRNVNRVMFISTDKAMNPINTYGTSKLMAEKLILDANSCTGWKNIRFGVCRYGNVIGSSGSVVPYWRSLIDKGAKVLPVTHPDMTRFWFPVKNAIEFVIDSIQKLPEGGEIFIPVIPSIKITDLATAFGLPYEIVGLRPNEKIHESLTDNYSSDKNEFLTVEQIKESIKEWL